MNQLELKNGQEYHFDNEKWCKENLSDDIRSGFVAWSERLKKFIIYFNGDYIYASKTFFSAEKRLKTLMGQWNLEFCETTY